MTDIEPLTLLLLSVEVREKEGGVASLARLASVFASQVKKAEQGRQDVARLMIIMDIIMPRMNLKRIRIGPVHRARQ